MTDPFMLDQREAETSLARLKASLASWRSLRGTRSRGVDGSWTEAMEYQLQGLEGSIKNAIRDTKWNLDELEETCQLLAQHEAHFSESEDLKLRRAFLELARQDLAQIELEILVPSEQPPSAVNAAEAEAEDDSSEDNMWEKQSQKQLCAEAGVAADANKMTKLNKKCKLTNKSVSWHRNVRDSVDGAADNGAAWQTAKPKLLRVAAQLAKHRLWISVGIAVALFVLVLIALSVSKAKRLQALRAATDARHTTIASSSI